ncbi:apolipoprotein D-like [Haliotis asinina]|uniref:apolipoprotein D-like n=1 Tax=Haliotis asinina TaxID=109174 RepID=UPI0035325534
MKTVFSVVLLTVLVTIQGQVPALWRCPNVPVQVNFTLSEYLGTWYEYERFFAIYEIGAECAQANYSMKADGHVKVLNSGRGRSIEGDAYAPDPSVPAKLLVKFFWWQRPGNYWVVETDYLNYAVVYSCTELYFMHLDTAWLLTRRRDGIPDDLKYSIYSRLSSYGINTRHFKKTKQTGC